MRRAVILVAGRNPLDELGGGHSAYVRTHGLAARRAGLEVVIACVGRGRRVTETPFGRVVQTRSLPLPLRQTAIVAHTWPLAALLGRLAGASEGAAILHGFGLWGLAAVQARDRLRRRGRAAVAIISSYTAYAEESRTKLGGLAPAHGRTRWLRQRLELAWIRRTVSPLEGWALRRADLVTVNYESVERLLRERFGAALKPRRTRYAPEAAFAPTGPAGTVGEELPHSMARAPLKGVDAPLIVCVARQEPRKGVDVLLRALAELAARGVPFRACLAGPGPLLEVHRRLAAHLGLGAHVVLPGLVDSVAPLLEAADIFALPSHAEQSGSLAVLEALRAGKPIVASACDGLLEDLAQDREALLVPAGDAGALAESLARVLADSELRARLGLAARATFLERFNAETFAADLAAVYAEASTAADGGPADAGMRCGRRRIRPDGGRV